MLRRACEALLITGVTFYAPLPNDINVLLRPCHFFPPKALIEDEPDKVLFLQCRNKELGSNWYGPLERPTKKT